MWAASSPKHPSSSPPFNLKNGVRFLEAGSWNLQYPMGSNKKMYTSLRKKKKRKEGTPYLLWTSSIFSHISHNLDFNAAATTTISTFRILGFDLWASVLDGPTPLSTSFVPLQLQEDLIFLHWRCKNSWGTYKLWDALWITFYFKWNVSKFRLDVNYEDLWSLDLLMLSKLSNLMAYLKFPITFIFISVVALLVKDMVCK